MGNSTSISHESTSRMKTHLSILEEKLHSIEASHHYHYAWPDAENDLIIDGAQIKCKKGVHVVIGPVIGRVDAESAHVLLEVDQNAEVTCNVCMVDKDCPEGRLFSKVKKTFRRNMPSIFELKNLVSGRRYTVNFSGVNKKDAKTRTGRFKTFDLEDQRLRIIALSEDSPPSVLRGEKNLWQNVYESVMDENEPIDVVVHLGGQVELRRKFEDAWMMLRRHVQSDQVSHLVDKGWDYLDEKTYSMLREAYIFQWNLPPVRRVLSSVSNLMMWSDSDMYPQFTSRSEFYVDHSSLTPGMHVSRVLLRAGRRLFHYYQRQLWDSNIHFKEEQEKPAIEYAKRSLDIGKRLIVLKSEGEICNAARLDARKVGDFQAAKQYDSQLADIQKEEQRLSFEVKSLYSELHGNRGEEFFHVHGHCGILMIDMRGNRLYADGSQGAGNDLFNDAQWEFFEKVMGQKEIHVLVLAMELPIADAEEKHTKKNIAESPVYHALGEWWSSFPDSQERFFTMISDWKLAQPGREVIILSGSYGDGLAFGTTNITDLSLRVSYKQIMVGPLTRTMKQKNLCDILLASNIEGVIRKNFKYRHEFYPYQERNFSVVDIRNIESKRPLLETQIHHQRYGEVNVTLGPVIGLVTTTTARILLEVDGDSVSVVCFVQNSVLQMECHRCTRLMSSKQPTVFLFTRLKAEQQYHVYFEGISHPENYEGSFRTPSLFPTEMNLLVISSDSIQSEKLALHAETVQEWPSTMKSNVSTELWPAVQRAVSIPFSPVDIVLHLGGQVHFQGSSAFENALALYNSFLSTTASSEDYEKRIQQTKSVIRELYRHQWNLASTRETLASGSHLMIWSEMDVYEGFTSSSGSVYKNEAIPNEFIKLLRSVYHEYQRALWGADCSDYDTAKEYVHVKWGCFGLFMMDLLGNKVSRNGHPLPEQRIMAHTQLQDLQTFLQDVNLQTVVIAASKPFVDNSMQDAAAKARFDSTMESTVPYHKQDLSDFLEIVFKWKNEKPQIREVLLVSGNRMCGLESWIKDTRTSQYIYQRIVGPISYCPLSLNLEQQGSLGEHWVYEHSKEIVYQHFTSIRLCIPNETSAFTSTEFIIDGDDKKIVGDNPELCIQSANEWKLNTKSKLPPWLLDIHSKKYHTGDDIERLLEQRMKDFERLMGTEYNQKALKDSFQCALPPLLSSDSYSLAYRCSPSMKSFYKNICAELRHVLPRPSQYYLLRAFERAGVRSKVLEGSVYQAVMRDMCKEMLEVHSSYFIAQEIITKEILWKEQKRKTETVASEGRDIESDKEDSDKPKEEKEETNYEQESSSTPDSDGPSVEVVQAAHD